MKNTLLLLFIALVFSATLSAQNYNARTDVLMQGFNWDSHSNNAGWYNVVKNNAADMGNAGFTMVWLPPPSDAAAPQGYLPRELYDLNTEYGTKAELKSCINRLHNNGMKVLADIVVNHRVGSTNWADFTNPTWGCWAVTRNDEWGQNGGNPCGGWDTGDNYHAARDLNHRDSRVRNGIRDWMNWLKNSNNAGFDGWRYDYVKGFGGNYVQTYNNQTNPYFTVGELWDNLNLNNVNAHRQQIVNWIDATGGKSAAFDFTTKGVLQAAVNNQYWRLRINNAPPGVIGWWPSRAVTFVDNHDTGSSQNYWPFPGGKVMQGYAYILTHPGVPSVFWDHYFDWGLKNQIRALMRVRKDNGLHSESSVSIREARWNLYAAVIDDKVAMKIGPGSWSPGPGWTLATSGNDYAVWERSNAGNLTIHFRPNNWNNPKLYFWNATPSGATTGWPGRTMTAEGNGWYKYTLSNTNCTNFIISNNGGAQSPDLYTCNEVWITQGNWNINSLSAPTETTANDFATGEELTLAAYPNPARGSTDLQLTLPTTATAELRVYDLHGRTVANPGMDSPLPAGTSSLRLDTSSWPAGVYIVRLQQEGETRSLRLMVR